MIEIYSQSQEVYCERCICRGFDIWYVDEGYFIYVCLCCGHDNMVHLNDGDEQYRTDSEVTR